MLYLPNLLQRILKGFKYSSDPDRNYSKKRVYWSYLKQLSI